MWDTSWTDLATLEPFQGNLVDQNICFIKYL